MVPQSQHANNTTLLAPNEPPGTLPDLDSLTWGGGNRSRGEKGRVSLHEHPRGRASRAAQHSCWARKGSGGAVGHSTKLPTSTEKSFVFLRRDQRAHPSPVVSPVCSVPFSTMSWAPQPLGPSCTQPPSCHELDVHVPFSTTKPEVRDSMSFSLCTQHQTITRSDQISSFACSEPDGPAPRTPQPERPRKPWM